ncbi:MAG: hypothetical protein RL318_2018 [Fibrobacterota bacterium]|jgi:hypothetical protein
MTMRRLLLAILLPVAVFAASKSSIAIAPAIVRGAVPMAQEAALSKALAEMLSWELSMLPSIKVTDPADAGKALGTTERTELGDGEMADAESAGRRLGVDAFVLPRLQRSGDHLTVDAILSVVKGTRTNTFRWSVQGQEDKVLPMVRQAAITLADSLGIRLPDAARKLINQTQGSSWAIIELFAKGVQAEDEGRKPDALAFYREAQSRGAAIPAMLVRMKKLEAFVTR